MPHQTSADKRTHNAKDRLYAEPLTQPGDFVFDARVAAVFPDMIQRSVPGYAAIINTISLLTEMYAQPGTHLYDLGCSLGAVSLAMAQGLAHDDCRIIAIDNATAMLQQARANLAGQACIEYQLADLRDAAINNASVVVLNFTLQFIPPADRLELLHTIRQGMLPGGILLLSEKITGADPAQDKALIDLHHAFKRAQGYSDLEISQKRDALEKVLLPETIATHQTRLQQAGFQRSEVWFQCFNFVSILAHT